MENLGEVRSKGTVCHAKMLGQCPRGDDETVKHSKPDNSTVRFVM